MQLYSSTTLHLIPKVSNLTYLSDSKNFWSLKTNFVQFNQISVTWECVTGGCVSSAPSLPRLNSSFKISLLPSHSRFRFCNFFVISFGRNFCSHFCSLLRCPGFREGISSDHWTIRDFQTFSSSPAPTVCEWCTCFLKPVPWA